MAERQYDLGDAELEVLKVLWDLGPSTVRDVLDHLHGYGRKIAYTTVQTLLIRLELKGFTRSDKSDLAHVFRAKISRNRVSKSRLKTLLNQMYDGSAGSLVLQLVKNEKLSKNEVDELQKLIAKLDSKKQN